MIKNEILVIDGQGGGLGKSIIETIKKAFSRLFYYWGRNECDSHK